MGERKVYRVLVGNPKERDHSEDRGVNGRMGSELILGTLAGGCNGIMCLRIEEGGGLL
jgi:hypothetical protein